MVGEEFAVSVAQEDPLEGLAGVRIGVSSVSKGVAELVEETEASFACEGALGNGILLVEDGGIGPGDFGQVASNRLALDEERATVLDEGGVGMYVTEAERLQNLGRSPVEDEVDPRSIPAVVDGMFGSVVEFQGDTFTKGDFVQLFVGGSSEKVDAIDVGLYGDMHAMGESGPATGVMVNVDGNTRWELRQQATDNALRLDAKLCEDLPQPTFLPAVPPWMPKDMRQQIVGEAKDHAPDAKTVVIGSTN